MAKVRKHRKRVRRAGDFRSPRPDERVRAPCRAEALEERYRHRESDHRALRQRRKHTEDSFFEFQS